MATSDEFLCLNPKVYAAELAADLPEADAEFMANSQVFSTKAAFETKINKPAWKSKKRWALVATENRAIRSDLMRMMAQCADSTMIEVKARHAVFMSQPEAVAGLIEDAAKLLSKSSVAATWTGHNEPVGRAPSGGIGPPDSGTGQR